MITPEWLDKRLNMLSVHKALQESILRDIVRRMMKTDFTVTDTAAWQAEKLQQSGMLYDDIIAEISKQIKKTAAEVRAAFDAAETEVFNYDDEALEGAGIDPKIFRNISPAMKSILTAAGKKTFTAAKNITKTTAVTTQSAFINACDVAHMKISSGAFSYGEALRQAVKSAAVQGFTVMYPTGRRTSLDAAVRRAVLTGVNQTCGKLQEMRADEYEVDLMEITAHFGARPTHAEWQGQVVSRSGRSGYLTLDEIGYGAVDGFMGANCRHNWHMYFEGLSRRAYTPEQLEQLKNETVTYDDEQMPVWQARERQRAMERSVRRYKQELVAYDEAMKNVTEPEEKMQWQTEFNSAAVKLKSKEAQIKDFCEQTGLQRETSREQVFAAATENGIKGFGKSVSGKAVESAQHEYDVWRKGIGAENTPKTLAKYYDMKYNDKQEHSRLQKYVKMVDKGEATPLLGYELYRNTALEIENKLIGVTSVNNIEINDYSAHFVVRVLGRTNKSIKYNRDGVSVDDIKEALVHGTVGKNQVNTKGQNSVVFWGTKCKVSVNPNENKLIQVNRRDKK